MSDATDPYSHITQADRPALRVRDARNAATAMLYIEGPVPGWVITGIFRESNCFRVCAFRLPLDLGHEAEDTGEDLDEALKRLSAKIEQQSESRRDR